MASKDLQLVISAVDKASREIKDIWNNIQGFAQKNRKTFQRMAVGWTAAFAGITTAVSKSIQEFAKFEQAEVWFESMLGSAEAATNMMEDLKTFSAETPFQFADIAGATRTLVAFGSEWEEAKDQIKFLWDIAAGAQVPLGDMSTIFGKIQTRGKAMTKEINQMSGRWIPIIGKLAEQFDVSKEAIFEMAEEGKLTDDVVTDALRSMTEEWWMFEDQMSKQAETLTGRRSTLKDNISLSMAEIGQVFSDEAGFIIDKLINITKGISSWVEENPELTATIIWVVGVLSGLVATVGAIWLALPSIMGGLAALKTAFLVLTWPVWVVIAAIAGLAYAWKKDLGWIQDKTSKVIWYIKGLWEDYWAYIKEYVKAIMLAVKDTFDVILNALKKAIEWWVMLVEAIWEQWWDDITSIFESVLSYFQSFFGAWKKAFAGDWEWAWADMQNMLDQILNIMYDLFINIFGDIAKWMWWWFKDTATKFADWGRELIQSLIDWINSIWWEVKETIMSLMPSPREIANNAKNWGKNVAGWVSDGLKAGAGGVKDAAGNVAGWISDMLGFHSPTKEWPWSDSDQWIPNLLRMMKDGFRLGARDIWQAAYSVAESIRDNFDVDNVVRKIQDIKVDAIGMFDDITSKISGQKSNLQDLVQEYKDIGKEIDNIDDRIANIKGDALDSIADRAIAIEDKLANIADKQVEREERLAELKKDLKDPDDELTENQRERIENQIESLKNEKKEADLKEKQLNAELKVAKANTTTKQIKEAQKRLDMTITDKIIEQRNEKIRMAEEEKQRLEEERKKKLQNIKDESIDYALLIKKKNKLDEAYFKVFGKQISKAQKETQNTIDMLNKMSRLQTRENNIRNNAKGSDLDKTVRWERALGWPVQANRSYIVWENWPEIFTPNSSGKINNSMGGWANISINMWWVTVNNEADENRLVDKIKRELTNEIQLYKFWIS